MAVLEKIRVKFGVLITVLIAVALLAFIVDPSTLESTIRVFSSKYDVGKINGTSIRAEDFQAKVDEYSQIYNITTGSQSVSEQALDQIRESAWQDLQNELYVIPLFQKAGINVGEEELAALTSGSSLSPVITRDPVFCDASGQFNREQFNMFLSSVSSDPNGTLGKYWSFLVKNVRQQQYFTKYSSLLSQSNILNPVEMRREIAENNVSSNVDFVMVPMPFGIDSTISVSNDEIQAYYKKHIDEYQQGDSRDIEFVAFESVPSVKDVEDAQNAIEKLYDEFSTTDNLKAFLSRNSETPLSNYYYKKGELESQYPEVDEFAFSADPTVLPILKKENTFIAARVNDTKMMSDSAFVMHILLSQENGNNQNRVDSLKMAAEKGADFSQLAAAWSLDTNPNVEHVGDLGWMTQNMMIPGMESVLTMAPGSVAVISTQYGKHIVKVTERTAPVKKVQIAILTKTAAVSNETVKTYYAKANDLASRCEGKIANFDKITSEENLPVVPVNNVLQTARKISKYDNVREVTRWIYDAKAGEVSNILTVDNRLFFVVALKNVNKAGDIPVSKVAPTIQFTLASEKKVARLAEEVAGKIKGLNDINAVAEALGTTVSHNDNIAFGSITSQTFEPKLIGAVAAAEEGQISAPVQGATGVYVFCVNSRDNGSFYTEEDAAQKSKQLFGYQLNTLSSIFKKQADVQDNRARFY